MYMELKKGKKRYDKNGNDVNRIAVSVLEVCCLKPTRDALSRSFFVA